MPKKLAVPMVSLIALLLMVSLALAAGVDLIKAGNKAAQAGKFEEAVKMFTQALRASDLSPANRAVALNNRGSAKDDLGQTDWAIMDYKEALKTNPKYAEVYYNLSYAYERKGQTQAALSAMEKAVGLAPADKDFKDRLMYLKGKLLKESGGR